MEQHSQCCTPKDEDFYNDEKEKKTGPVSHPGGNNGESKRPPSDDESSEEEAGNNYNTITSLAALKDLLQSDEPEAPADSFFQHYFLHHCNNLSSRESVSPYQYSERRRLSECREEDEDESHPTPIQLSSECTVSTNTWNKQKECTVMGAKHKFLVTTINPPALDRVRKVLSQQTNPAHTVHFGTHGAEELKPRVCSIFSGENLHRDKTYFDSSLIEIRSSTESFSIPSNKFDVQPESDDIWVKQTESKKVYKIASDIELEETRPRSGTWGAQTDVKNTKRAHTKKPKPSSDEQNKDKIQTHTPKGKVATQETAFTRSSPTVGESSPPNTDHIAPEQITIHGTSGVSMRPASKDVFRRGSAGNSSFMKNVRSAWQSMAPTSTKPTLPAVSDESVLPHSRIKLTSSSDGSAHPLAGRDEYYHTLTAATARKPGAIARVRDLFRKQDSLDYRKTRGLDLPSAGQSSASSMESKRKSSDEQSLNASSDKIESTKVSKSSSRRHKKDADGLHALGSTEHASRKHIKKVVNKSKASASVTSTAKKCSSGVAAESSKITKHNSARLTMAKVKMLFSGEQTPEGEMRRKRALAQHRQLKSANLRRVQELERRRFSLDAPRHLHRASDASIDPLRAAILFRDSRGLPVANLFIAKARLSDLQKNESQIFVKFFKFHSCYDLIPTSAKLVVFDTELLVKKAFFALVENGVRAAPLWDSKRQMFVGMLTITDFIKILQMYYTSPNVAMDELEEHRLGAWTRVLKGSVMPLVSIGPNESLYDAIHMLISNRIHRLPIIDPETGDCLYILTHKRILRFLFLYIKELPKPAYLQHKLRDLSVGTYGNIEMATEETSIIEALKKFVNRRVSALPLVDEMGRLKDIYAKFDVINLAAEKTYNDLDVTLKKANEHRNEWFEGVQKCTLDETLFQVMDRIVHAEVHRLVVVDEEDKVIGIISLSDLLSYLVLRPSGDGTALGHDSILSKLSVSDSENTEDEACGVAPVTPNIPEEEEKPDAESDE